MKDPVIISAVRTPIGKFQGALKHLHRHSTGKPGRARRSRARGAVSGTDRRSHHGQCRLRRSWPESRPSGRTRRRTASRCRGNDDQQGLRIRTEGRGLAAQGILTGDSEIVVAGGMESMSNAPYLLPERARRISPWQWHDRRFDDPRRSVGRLRELPHGKYRRDRGRKISRVARTSGRIRAEQPSQGGRRRFVAGKFTDEIVPVPIPQKTRRSPALRYRRISSRPTPPREALRALKPAFKKDGTVTAGNAPGVNDGAAALVVTSAERAAQLGKTPLARIVGQAVSGIEPMLLS